MPEPYREEIETARPPFHEIDVIRCRTCTWITFIPNPSSGTSGTMPAPRSFRPNRSSPDAGAPDYAAIKSRVTTITPPLKEKVVTVGEGWRWNGQRRARHGPARDGPEPRHIITLGGKKVLHIGDASTEDASIFEAFDLDGGADRGGLPAYVVSDQRRGGGHRAAKHQAETHRRVHMPADDVPRAVAGIKQRLPDAVPSPCCFKRSSTDLRLSGAL